MRTLKNLNSTLFFLFLSLVTHGYNTQILLKCNHHFNQHFNHQKKCISNPNLKKLDSENDKNDSLNRKNKSIGFEVSILELQDFIFKKIFSYCIISIPTHSEPDLSFAFRNNPKRGPPLQ